MTALPLTQGLPSHAATTAFTETGPLHEIDAVCARLVAVGQGCDVIGTSAGGRAIRAFTLSSVPAARRATDAEYAKRPVVLVLGGIHAGEIDGKDAITLVVQELLSGPKDAAEKPGDRALLQGALDAVTVVFVPVYNVDGFARFGENHRPNQRGPVQTGWRVNDLNLNLNRDWAKADAPETRALVSLIARLDPVVVVDLHVTDGAQFQHDIAIVTEPVADDGSNAPLLPERAALSSALITHLTTTGHRPLDFYPSFEVDDDPASGIATGVTPARLTHGYVARRGRLGVLVETHSWQPYRARVFATADTLRGLLSTARVRAGAWQQAERAVDAQATSLPGRTVVVAWDVDREQKETFAFQGYRYTREPSAISGALWTRYDETQKQTWNVPLWRGVKPASTTTAPPAYAIEPAFAPLIAERLRAHGVAFSVLDHDVDVRGATWSATSTTFAPKPYEGRQTVKLAGNWSTSSTLVLPAGTLVVPVGQPRGRLVVDLCEPTAAESFAGWGFFNSVFEQKEYMEDYVAEAEARRMLASDPALQQAFRERLRTDRAFAADAAARLDFFYRRHPAWDPRKDRLPVVRLDALP